MKIAFLTTRLDKPSTRYRILQYLPLLEKNGFSSEIKIFPKNIFHKYEFYDSLSDFDAVFVQRKLLSKIEMYLLRKNSKKLVFDFDDALMYKDSNKKTLFSRQNQIRFERIVKTSDSVIAGNQYLYDQALKFNPNTFIIPTCVDMERYTPKTIDPSETIGWLGTASTLIYLKNIIPALVKVYERNPGTCLKIVADDFIVSDKIPIIKKLWKYEEEIKDIHSFDIGLMPLSNDMWSMGKCGLKLIQYMACGVASICSPVGVNSEIVQDGVNGFHAADENEWIGKLELLIKNPALRIELGQRARETVINKYSTSVNVVKLMDVLNEHP